MSNDTKLAALMTECLSELDQPGADATKVRAILAEIEVLAPGQIEAMAARLQLRRLGLATRH